MAVQNHSPYPGFNGLKLEDVFPAYNAKGEAEFDICLVARRNAAPMRFKPEAIVLLSELAVGRERILSPIERGLLGELPKAFLDYNGSGIARPSQIAIDASYTFYHR